MDQIRNKHENAQCAIELMPLKESKWQDHRGLIY